MNAIATESLTRIYRQGDLELRALDGVTVSIERGEMTAIMGPSGSGKSTFMNIVGCLDKPAAGRCLIEGRDVGRLGRDELAAIRNKHIGFVFQAYNLLPRTTAYENVELPLVYRGVPPAERRRRCMEALGAVGLADRGGSMPNQLSGGQQQRVAIARAIVNQASLILADEPTGNLDTKSSHEIMDIFTGLNSGKGITILLVTHERDIAAYARRTLRFLDGRIVGDTAAARGRESRG
jgi:putative ABC transport system ATP-binding protein